MKEVWYEVSGGSARKHLGADRYNDYRVEAAILKETEKMALVRVNLDGRDLPHVAWVYKHKLTPKVAAQAKRTI